MTNENIPSQNDYIDVRFNLVYSIFIVFFGVAAIIWAFLAGGDPFIKYYFIFIGLILLIHGIYAISGGKYIRLDPKARKIIFSGFLASIKRPVNYEKLFFKGKDLYRLTKGKERYINIIWYQCRKSDLNKLIKQVKEGIFQ
jgi:hypothetical protein